MAYGGRRHSRVFFDIAAEYPAVYADDGAFATWVRLLMIADGLWPVPAVLPRSVQQEPLETLVTAGLISVSGDHFEVKGLHKMRQAEHEQQAANAKKRWESERNATASATAPTPVMPSKAKQSKQSRASNALSLVDNSSVEESDDNGDSGVERATLMPEVMALAEDLTGTPYAMKSPFSGWADSVWELISRHGWPAVEQAMRLVAERIGRPTIKELVRGTEEAMARRVDTADLHRQAEAEERQQERTTASANRVQATLRQNHFQHLTPHPVCELCGVTPAIDPKVISH